MTKGAQLSQHAALIDLNARAREIFRNLVASYLATGEPVGSRNLARQLPMVLSPASVRTVMSDLERTGLIYAPHLSAGRLPTELGLRFFVDALLELAHLPPEESAHIEQKLDGETGKRSMADVLTEATLVLSGLSGTAAVVLTPKQNLCLKHVEFVLIGDRKALMVLVSDEGSLENRILTIPAGLSPSALVEAANFINAHLQQGTLSDVLRSIAEKRDTLQLELDSLTARLVEQGLAISTESSTRQRHLIVRGKANLLSSVTAADDLERLRLLFSDLETQTDVIELLEQAEAGEGVRIYIGSENRLFSLSGSALIAAPFRSTDQQVIGVLGVIGPTRLNYARVIPMVDYTARMVAQILGAD